MSFAPEFASEDQDIAGLADVGIRIDRLARAVVIGIGGSGIQTISRLRSRVLGKRPDADATSSISFLGIDSVGTQRQVPPLPPGVNLAPADFYNLAEGGFDADSLVRHQGHLPRLQSWWDGDRKVPPGPLIDGMKQDRMLGRLAFFQRGDTVASRVQSAVMRALALNASRMSSGHAGQSTSVTSPRFYVVGSSCGGTGSSGTLEVLYAIWSAARTQGMTPDITMLTYTPGVFEEEIRRNSQASVEEISNLRANAYAFFRELDHFIEKSSELKNAIAHAEQLGDPELVDGHLVKQVFLIDSVVEGAGFVSEIEDIYEMTAEALFQFLMTDVGDRSLNINATNTPVLDGVDGYRKRRLYCGLMVGSVLFPGDTVRYHLANRFYDYWLTQTLLERPVDLPEMVRRSDAKPMLLDALLALISEVEEVEQPEQLARARDIATTAAQEFKDDWREESITNRVGTVREDLPGGISDYRDLLRRKRQALATQIEQIVTDAVLDSCQGVDFCAELVSVVRREILGHQRDWMDYLTGARRNAAQARDDIDPAEAALKASGAAWWSRVIQTTVRRDAEHLGARMQTWVNDSTNQERVSAQLDLVREMLSILEVLEARLVAAKHQLELISEHVSKAWRQDNLLGKDRNPRAMTAFVPEDIMPKVEDCELNRRCFVKVREALKNVELDTEQRVLFTNWRAKTREALFALGSENKDILVAARKALSRELARLADQYVFERGTGEVADPDAPRHEFIVPRDLSTAASTVDGGASLQRALESLGGIIRRVALSVDEARLNVSTFPVSTTTLIRPRDLAGAVDSLFPKGPGLEIVDGADPEKIVALNMLWGTSLHAITVVSGWKNDYERLLTSLPQDKEQKRMHIHREWQLMDGYLNPLVPKYGDADLAASVYVQLELASALLDDQSLVEFMFPLDSLEETRPLRTQRHDGSTLWEATIYRQDPDASRGWYVVNTSVIGDSQAEVLDRIAIDIQLRQYISGFLGQLIDETGFDPVIAELKRMQEKFDGLVQLHRPKSKDKEAVGKIASAVGRQLREYQIAKANSR